MPHHVADGRRDQQDREAKMDGGVNPAQPAAAGSGVCGRVGLARRLAAWGGLGEEGMGSGSGGGVLPTMLLPAPLLVSQPFG